MPRMTKRPSPRPSRHRLRALSITALALGAAVPSAEAADPILPLSQVTTGMVGEARTVVRGTDIVTFPVTVIDVQRSGDAPGGALILIRAEGPLIEQTGGIAQGMSGSPVYVRGSDGVQRVIGAVAYGTGDQANVIGGVTPIEQMLAVASGPRALSRSVDAVRRPLRVVASRSAARREQRRTPGTRALYPLERWSIAGLDRRLASALGDRLGTEGVQVSTIGPRTIRPPATLVPGASMTALAMGGDVVFGATGTVTYVDGATVLGFGHPFTSAGTSRMLLGDAWIFTTIAAPIGGGSYKLAEPGTTQGMIVGDRRDGVVGTLGATRAIKVHATAFDTLRRQSSDLNIDLVSDPSLTPAIADALQAESLLRVRDGIPSGTVAVNVGITTEGGKKRIVYRNLYASAGDVTSISLGAISRPVSVLLNNSTRVIEPTRVEISQTLDPEIRAARVVSAQIVPARAKPGAKVKLVLTLQRFRDNRRRVVLPFRLPAGLEAGPRTFKIIPNAPGGFDPGGGDLVQALGESAALGKAARTRVDGLALAVPSGSRAERVLKALRRTLRDRHDAVRVLGPDDDKDSPKADDGTTVAVPGTVIYSGSATARVRAISRK